MDGNGEKLRETIRQLSGLSRILADGSGNIVDIIKNLQTFVTVLRDSNVQIVQFQDRLATVSSVLDGSRSDLDAALTNLSSAVVDVQRFVAGSRNQTAEQVERLADVVRNLSDNQTGAEEPAARRTQRDRQQLQHLQPRYPKRAGRFRAGELLQPAAGGLRGDRSHRERHRQRDRQTVLAVPRPGAAADQLQLPAAAVQRLPGQVAESVEPDLLRTASGARRGRHRPTVEIPPEISAYTGLNGDVPPPPGWGGPPGTTGTTGAPTPRSGLPADPQPALYPGAPVPAGVPHGPAAARVPAARRTLQDMLLPARVARGGRRAPPPPPPVPLPPGSGGRRRECTRAVASARRSPRCAWRWA